MLNLSLLVLTIVAIVICVSFVMPNRADFLSNVKYSE